MWRQFIKEVGSENCKTNYRPISILPTLSKFCESIIHERLLSHCLENKIITDKQAAFLKGDSTISQPLYLVHLIRTNWGKGKITHVLFLDICAVFDKIWHKGLLAKLQQIRISDAVLTLFTSYLSNRKQCVVVDGIKFPFIDINAGVPQGSRLGPHLFILYSNDIVNILIFADDCTLLASGVDPSQTGEILNRDLVRISVWAELRKLTFSAGKSKEMVFSNKMLNNSPTLLLGNIIINRSVQCPYPWLVPSDKLNNELGWENMGSRINCLGTIILLLFFKHF